MAKKLLVVALISLSVVSLTSYAVGSPASTDYVDKKIQLLESKIASVPSGPQGPAGPQGAAGPAGANGANGEGVIAGGAAGQVLAKIDATDYNTQWVNQPTSLYAIGRHTEGGIVFFVYLDSGNVQHALIAAPADEPGGAAYPWGLAATPGTAQNQCENKNDGTYADWFLPNKAQITALFMNRYAFTPVVGVPLPGNSLINNGGFEGVLYWSSTEYDINTAWSQRFSNSNQEFLSTKVTLLNVRCIRAV